MPEMYLRYSAKNPKNDGYQRRLALAVYEFFNIKSSDANTLGGTVARANKSAVKSEIISIYYKIWKTKK